MANEQQSSWVFRVSSVALALGFLGFLMLRAGGVGCSKPSAPIGAESPSGNSAAPTEGVATPTATPPPATAAANPTLLAQPNEPAPAPSAAAPVAAPTAAKPTGKPSGPPPGYFPGTKAAPMPWANENPPAQPAPQQQAPQK